MLPQTPQRKLPDKTTQQYCRSTIGKSQRLAIPACVRRKVNDCFLWTRTQLSIRALSHRHCDGWTKARLAAVLRRALKEMRRYTQTSYCGISVCGCGWRELPAALSCFARVMLFRQSVVLTNDFLARRTQRCRGH